jgi:CrcB protein
MQGWAVYNPDVEPDASVCLFVYPPLSMTRLLWICLGGAVGTGARYLIGGWIARNAGTGFPWGTFAVNALGSFLLGAILQVALTTDMISPTLRIALTTGVMGGFTTYSTFNYETLQLLLDDSWFFAVANLGVTVIGCLLAGALGLLCGRLLVG